MLTEVSYGSLLIGFISRKARSLERPVSFRLAANPNETKGANYERQIIFSYSH